MGGTRSAGLLEETVQFSSNRADTAPSPMKVAIHSVGEVHGSHASDLLGRPTSPGPYQRARRIGRVNSCIAPLILAGLLAVGLSGSALGRGAWPLRVDGALSLGDVHVSGGEPHLEETDEVSSIRHSAERGDAAAQYMLGLKYDWGEGVAKDPAEAIKWYRLASAQGQRLASNRLGCMYDWGDGVPKDSVEATKWFRIAAAQGDAYSQVELGFMYQSGRGAPKDVSQAAKWYQLAAEQGDVYAQVLLGGLYQGGDGIPKDFQQAVKWFRLAASRGNAIGQAHLGHMYYTGEGVQKDPAEAAKWLRLAADQGNADAQWSLGILLELGEGIEKNHVEAIKLCRLAADQGVAPARFYLGWQYEQGNGVAKDFTEAARWYRLAADQGEPSAQLALGNAYSTATGVRKDDVQAYQWFNLSAAAGNQQARKNLELIEKRMTPSQIAEAQKLSREFRPVKGKADREDGGRVENPGDLTLAETGSGFFITEDGYFVTAAHVIADAKRVKIRVPRGTLEAALIQADRGNDLALLKCEAKVSALPVQGSGGIRLGARVVTVGFPNPDLQGCSPKFGQGEIAGLAGPQDDPRYFQVSVPIQPGNSGGPLADARGSAIGVIVSKLDQMLTLQLSGQIPENVNYAVKGSHLMAFLESVPGLTDKLRKPAEHVSDGDLPQVVQAACGMVLVYH